MKISFNKENTIKKITYLFCILTISFLLNSCATILNSKKTKLKIISNKPANVIIHKDTLIDSSTKKQVFVSRSKAPLRITVFNDTIQKTIAIKSKNSFAYWLNLYPITLWTGFLIDRHKPKRYAYPKLIYIDLNDTIPRYFTYYPWSMKGNIDIHLSVPYINTFMLQPENEGIKKNTGFWGLNIGLDYYHSKKQFLNFNISSVTDFFLPLPAAVDIVGEYELMSSIYIAISNNHTYRRFTFGYGVSLARNSWSLNYADNYNPPPPTRDPVTKSHFAYGMIFQTYYQVDEDFYIGIIYRPTFYKSNITKKFEYEYLVSVDFAWKLNLGKTHR